MTGDQFRDTCNRLGLSTVERAARGLGCSPRQIDRYRQTDYVPLRVQRTLAALDTVRELRAEVRRLTRELAEKGAS